MIWDSTQSFNETAGNTAIARPGTYKGAGSHNRVQFSARNSRLGFGLAAPEYQGMKASAVIEGDFLGNQPAVSESAFFSSPTFRIRHAFLQLGARYVDLIMGQTWELLGWQNYFIPASVNRQGLPGQVESRTPQLRLSRVLPASAVDIELAAAALRPPQRDGGLPDFQGGVRVLFERWRGVHTLGGSSTSTAPGGVGVSGAVRRFVVNKPDGHTSSQTTGWAYSLDAFIPVIRAPAEGRKNALGLTGSYVMGAGAADQYTGLTGGVKTVGKLSVPATYTPNIEDGLASFDASATVHAIDWRSWMVGVQYYLPPGGKVFLSTNYTDLYSSNIRRYGAGDAVFQREHYADANVFWDVTPAVRFAGALAWFHQEYVDGTRAIDRRVQASAWFLF
jgi:hypothetical protein